MLNMKKFSLLFVLVLVMVVSCKRNEPNPIDTIFPGNPTTTNFSSEFFVANSVPVQSFNINSSSWQVITGSQGTRVTFSPGSFVTQTNQPVSGTVSIELKEIYSKKDMILSGISTVSNGMPLISGGEIKLVAKQNNLELKLAGNNLVYVEMPAGLNPSFQMNEFYADVVSGTNDWNSADTTTAIQVVPDSMSGGNFYLFTIDSMNWINCDYFSGNTGPSTDVRATVGNAYADSNCMVFVSFNGQNSAAHCFSYLNHTYSPGSYYTLPIGMAISFIAIAEINGQYYSDIHSSTVVLNHNETMNLQPTTLAQINAALALLP